MFWVRGLLMMHEQTKIKFTVNNVLDCIPSWYKLINL